MLKLKLQYFCHLMQRTDLFGKDPDAGKDQRQEEKRIVDERVVWHHQLDWDEFEQALGVSDAIQPSCPLSPTSAPSWHSWFDAFLGLPFSSLFPLSASFILGSSVHSHDFTYPHYNLHPTISSSVIPFSSCLQSFPASGSFPMSQFFSSGSQSTGASASESVLPMNIQDWFTLGLTGLISLPSKGLSRVFPNITVQKHQFFVTQLSL